MFRPAAAAALAALALATPVAAQDVKPDLSDPVSVRQHMMKAVGASMKVLGGMAKGEVDYDPVKAGLAFQAMNAAAVGFGSQFPEGSMAEDRSEAGPAIYDDRAGFDATLVAFAEDTFAAIQADPQTKDAFMPVFGAVAENCKACHEDYRVKRD
jgi:cytochrome c556